MPDFLGGDARGNASTIRSFELRTLVEEELDGLADLSESQGIELLFHASAEAPSVLRADQGLLRHRLVELVSKLMERIPEGELVLRVECCEGDGVREALRFHVACDCVASANEFERCSSHSFQLPWDRLIPEARSSSMDESSLPGKRALIVDGSRIVAEFCGSRGMDVVLAEYAQHGLALARAATRDGRGFDVVILDSPEGRASSFDLVRALREDPELTAIPIVVLNTPGQRMSAGLMARLGAGAYLAKPVRRGRLAKCLRSLFAVQANRGSKTQPAPSPPMPNRAFRLVAVPDTGSEWAPGLVPSHIEDPLRTASHEWHLVEGGRVLPQAVRVAAF